jgi:hypothetical protein
VSLSDLGDRNACGNLEFDLDLDCVSVAGGGDSQRKGLSCLAVVSLSDLGNRDTCGDLGFDPNLLLGNDGGLVTEIGP